MVESRFLSATAPARTPSAALVVQLQTMLAFEVIITDRNRRVVRAPSRPHRPYRPGPAH